MANIYLNGLDQFIKHDLKIKYYLRYADDFIILDSRKDRLESLIKPISQFLDQNLSLELHPRKHRLAAENVQVPVRAGGDTEHAHEHLTRAGLRHRRVPPPRAAGRLDLQNLHRGGNRHRQKIHGSGNLLGYSIIWRRVVARPVISITSRVTYWVTL